MFGWSWKQEKKKAKDFKFFLKEIEKGLVTGKTLQCGVMFEKTSMKLSENIEVRTHDICRLANKKKLQDYINQIGSIEKLV